MSKQTSVETVAVPRITDFVTVSELTKMEDIQGRDVLLTAIHPAKSEFGPGVRVTCSDAETGEVYELITSGTVLYPKLMELALLVERGQVAFPVAAAFVKKGRTWIIE